MEKPCDKCSVNVEQALLYDEVTCYQTCKKWQELRKEYNNTVERQEK